MRVVPARALDALTPPALILLPLIVRTAVGVKMVLEFFHYGVSSFASLAIITSLLTIGTVASILHNRSVASSGASDGTPTKSPAAKSPLDAV